MPYYVFWVECDGEQGVCYRPYYVPAVADAYIAGMPKSPTGGGIMRHISKMFQV